MNWNKVIKSELQSVQHKPLLNNRSFWLINSCTELNCKYVHRLNTYINAMKTSQVISCVRISCSWLLEDFIAFSHHQRLIMFMFYVTGFFLFMYCCCTISLCMLSVLQNNYCTLVMLYLFLILVFTEKEEQNST